MSLTYELTENPIAYDLMNNKIISYKYNFKKGGIKEAIGVFKIIPNFEANFENIYVFGAGGSGKSYFTANYALEYRKHFPKNDIYLFSEKENDPSFEVRHDEKGDTNIQSILRMRKVPLGEEFLESDLDILNTFNHCLLIFDDFLYFSDQRVIDKICKFIKRVLQLGRCNGIYCVITGHQMYQQKNNEMYAILQTEMHKLVWFTGANTYQRDYVLTHYWSLSKKQIKEINGYEPYIKYMFICINKMPKYIVTSHTCHIYK